MNKFTTENFPFFGKFLEFHNRICLKAAAFNGPLKWLLEIYGTLPK